MSKLERPPRKPRRHKVNATSKWTTPQTETATRTFMPPPEEETPMLRYRQLVAEKGWRDLTADEEKDLQALRALIPREMKRKIVNTIIWVASKEEEL